MSASAPKSSPQVFAYSDFRSYLRALLQAKMDANPKFSLRAFAKYLGISPTNLSEILRAKRGLSQDRADAIGRKVCRTSKERRFFELLVRLDSARSETLKSELCKKIEQFEPDLRFKSIQREQFKLIADWYHLALMTLVEFPLFSDLKPEIICRHLGITPLQFENAMNRLERLELIVARNGGWVRRDDVVRIQGEGHNLYLKRFHEQMLAKATASIRKQDRSRRISSSDVILLDNEGLEQARKILNSAIDRIYALSAKGKKDVLVGLSAHVFTLFPNPDQAEGKIEK